MNSVEDVKKNLEAFLEQDRRATVGKMTMQDCIDVFTKHLNEASVDDLIKENQTKAVRLFRSFDDAFKRNELIELNRLATVPDDVHRVNQIETIIDLYNAKITRVRSDESLSNEEREMKVQAWMHLMEKDIDAIGGAM